ncbi:hypothetical protein UO65_6080 [Actinokineospora spheciospongiae]|uniref:Cytoplasmic membrane protein FsxA n=1 Tax=Actinokineospora spheciospongiae TaxID=909613 RepID=W7IPK2_9PSEU|nr:membrane protein [Actinokineospora spheciospongiae]EWC58652.1 hypothetical protein UO65_6080 [Actinokineospora spheciospongiae]PWW65302.1 putative membrane protein [Actinokineospora spheciospongiae]
MATTDSRRAIALALLLGTAGTLHFVVPKQFDSLVPKELPGGRRLWTYLSGVAEATIALAVAVPRTRRLGGLLAALLFVAVFPGNVKMVVDYERKKKPLPARAIAWGRLPLQWPLVTWALNVRDSAPR